VIDGQGVYLCPGFIDVHTAADRHLTLTTDQSQEALLRQGITTVIGGHEGVSLAPVPDGSLAAIEAWAGIRGVNVDWRTVRDLLKHFDRRPLHVNFGTLSGHATMRRAIAGADPRELSANERRVVEHLLERALHDGAFGLSLDPAAFVRDQVSGAEVRGLLGPLKERRAFYAPAVSGTGAELKGALIEHASFLKRAGVPAIISHLPLPGSAVDGFEEFFEFFETLPFEQTAWFEVSPAGGAVFPVAHYLPLWAQTGTLSAIEELLDVSLTRNRILAELPALDPDRVRVIRADRHDSLIGCTLRNLMELYEIKKPAEALLKLMQTTGMRALVFETMESDVHVLLSALRHPRSLLASRDTGAVDEHGSGRLLRPDELNVFSWYVSRAVRSATIPLDEAIAKITRTPARLLGLERRGEVREGNYADLTGVNRTGEVKFVIVNGGVAFRDGELQRVRYGRAFRFHGSRSGRH
jgi:N-acyl-D-amino-acid deacylase